MKGAALRRMSRTITGGALALLLACSVAPANALDPVSPDGDVEVVDEIASVEVPGTEDKAELVGADETTEPVDEPGDQRDAAESPHTPAEEGAGESQEELTQAPERLAVEGVIAVVPDEAKFDLDLVGSSGNEASEEVHEAGEEAHEAGEEAGGGVLLATNAGPLIPLDPEFLNETPETGEDFTGTVELPEAARSAITEALSESGGSLTEAEALQIAGDTAIARGSGLTASGATGELPPVAEAATVGSHTADIAYVSGGAAPGSTALKNLVSGASSYWNTQTAGKVAKITANATVRSFSSGAGLCDTTSLWTQAAAKFGHSPQDYLRGARHLVVFVNAGSARCSGSGFGTLGRVHQGGLIWVDLQSFGAPNTALGTTAHEFGHNLGLGHGQTRQCSGSTTDAATVGRWFANYAYTRSVPQSPCVDTEYGDLSNIMGAGSVVSPTKPVALSMVQKYELGVLSSNGWRNVNQSAGRSQVFTIGPVGSNSGLRLLKVNPTSGGSFYVEYRSGTGQDSGLPWAANDEILSSRDGGGFLPSNYKLSTGVQVTKNYPGALPLNYGGGLDLRETLITSNQSVGSESGKFLALKQGKSLTPWNSSARVNVLSVASNRSSAKVQIEFAPFTDVPFAHKFAKEINWMNSSGLSTGYRAGTGLRSYAPKWDVSREAMAAFLYRMQAPKGYTAPARSPFVDVQPGQKFYKEITWMYKSGLSTGTKRNGARFYDPKASVSREAMAAFLFRMQAPKSYKAPAKSPLADMRSGQKFYREISWMYQSGLSTGTRRNGERFYDPKASVSREAMGAFLYRLKH